MRRVNIMVEGQTEDAFIRSVLAPYLLRLNIVASPRIIPTSKRGRGGTVSWGQPMRVKRTFCWQT